MDCNGPASALSLPPPQPSAAPKADAASSSRDCKTLDQLTDGSIHIIAEDDDEDEDPADERTCFETKDRGNAMPYGNTALGATRCTYRYRLPPPKPPPNYLIPALVLTLFNPLLGVPTVAFSLLSIRNFNRTYYQQANEGSTKALIFLIAGVISSTLIAAVVFIAIWQISEESSAQTEVQVSLEVTTLPGKVRVKVGDNTTRRPQESEILLNKTREWLDGIGFNKPKHILKQAGVNGSMHRFRVENVGRLILTNFTDALYRNITLNWLNGNDGRRRPTSMLLKRLNETDMDVP
ncbi:uncharacterized protein LOC106179306 [Lingula anatina]|uniref:Uncharacterized protein LOC106179306 n=1 Tax=Lingula anatina TaxID=7574 RepID=A0A1S3K7A4_LINAN|nr:uncharacterized protein LOC106179306 [Lingula anatina]XP_013418322.1 uncharacterized protein LOC106179306 [Lingula anatina]XP_013418323.1 uncharacterized protein LOC106179306 [Lingula anatina]XP_013418324.1 uncharacterized protein LOC106179306 [Lingula anatina]XP_013418325.1 uncharacterized protein LOC106179306 [Lingula anatina]XP_013418327.1 uncharacterized protein LOC106179306 [Lingula anatina]XP_013418328.1 uncharacterized protein LOC106179306 [Lingula anatina]XP_013418329.1 uncharacte|eukprot:XP_013418321.1 uncharacterized protein LOC106179306 [Lingula anatina]